MSRKQKFKASDLELNNLTHYSSVDLKVFLLAGIRSNGCTERKRITVKYTRHGQHWGYAELGGQGYVHNYRERFGTEDARFETTHKLIEGVNVLLTIPKDPAKLDLAEFARVLIHELDHTLGFHHRDTQPIDTIPIEWAQGLSIGLKLVKPKAPIEDRRASLVARREAHARAMAERWAKKAATAKRQLAKWTTKVRGYERRKAAKK